MGVFSDINVRLRRARRACVLVAFLGAVVAPAQAESIDRVVLPSGVTVIIAEQHTTQVVEVRIAVRAGPVYEGERLGSGLSLLTQRLVATAGAGDLNAAQMRDALARLGGTAGGTTALARSEFAFTTTAAGLPTALSLIARRLATPVILPEDLERERAAMNVLELPQDTTALMALLFRQHPARLPVPGLAALRNALTLDQVQAYHETRYRSANTVVVVCGNVAAVEARRQVEQAFAAYPLGGYAMQPLPSEPPPLVPRYQSLTSSTLKQPRVTIGWRTETLDHAAQPGLAVLATWLGGERGPLATALVDKGLGQELTVENHASIAMPGHLRLSFSTTNERRAEAEQVLYKTLEAVGQQPLDEAQIAAARAATQRQLAQRQGTVRGLCEELLAWELAAGDPAYVRRFAEQVAEVDGIEVMRELRRYLLSREGDRGRCTVVVRPADGKPVRANEPLKTPTPVSVVAPEVITLPHGVRLMLRLSLEQPLARVHLVLGGAAAVEDEFQHGATSLLAPLMCRATETRTPADIDALLTTRGMQLTTAADLHRLDLGVTCFPGDVPLALGLLNDVLCRAALPPDELELVRQRAAGDIANDAWERRFLAQVRAVTLAGHYAAADPRSAKAGLTHLDRSVVLAHYRRLAVGANAVLVVYGRFDRAAVIEQARTLITPRQELATGSTVLPRGTPWGDRGQSSLTVSTHDAPFAALALVWRGPTLVERARDEACMQVLGALLEARFQRALPAQGDVQLPRLSTSGESYDQRGIWLVSGACDEARLDQVQQTVRDEVARFIAQLWLPEADRGALPDSELGAAKATCTVRWALDQEDLGRVARRHATLLLMQQDLAVDLAMPDRFAAITRKDLLRVAQAWLAGEPMTVITKPKAAAAPLPAALPADPLPAGPRLPPKGGTPAAPPATSTPVNGAPASGATTPTAVTPMPSATPPPSP